MTLSKNNTKVNWSVTKTNGGKWARREGNRKYIRRSESIVSL